MTLTYCGPRDWTYGTGKGPSAGRLGCGIDLGLPSDVTLKGAADQKGLLQPRKGTVFALCPFPGVPKTHTG